MISNRHSMAHPSMHPFLVSPSLLAPILRVRPSNFPGETMKRIKDTGYAMRARRHVRIMCVQS